jgi:hypothetical protein
MFKSIKQKTNFGTEKNLEGEKIRSTPIRGGRGIYGRKLTSGCNYAFIMHNPIFYFLSVKMWTRQEENQICLPNLQYVCCRGWTPMYVERVDLE